MIFNKVHCLFEQSGTFRDIFKKYGYAAFDYDICNDFMKTNYQCDLFYQINCAYDNKKSILDNIKEDDLVIAFFPCTRFETQISMAFRGDSFQMKKWNDSKKLEYSIKLHNELHNNYIILCKLCIIAYNRKWKLIIENLYTQPHYLTSYFPIKQKVIDFDRRIDGDYYKKPTQYFFINCEPGFTFLNPIQNNMNYSITKNKGINGMNRKVSRSLINPLYAERFINRYILDNDIYRGDL